jgi:hypothetical protein
MRAPPTGVGEPCDIWSHGQKAIVFPDGLLREYRIICTHNLR